MGSNPFAAASRNGRASDRGPGRAAHRARAGLADPRDPEGDHAPRHDLARRRPAGAAVVSRRGAARRLRRRACRRPGAGTAVQHHRGPSAAARLDRRAGDRARRADRGRAGADRLRLAAGARPDRQGDGRRRQSTAGRIADLPRRVAGVRAVRPGLPHPADRHRRPAAAGDRRRDRARRPSRLRDAELPEPDRPNAELRAPRRTGGRCAPLRPLAGRGRSVRRALVRRPAAAEPALPTQPSARCASARFRRCWHPGCASVTWSARGRRSTCWRA
jgi:hypothetical protein